MGEGSADREFDGEIDEWEVHAGWWAERFTEGADVEYEEQILPLLAAELAGSERVLDIGCGEGQVSRLAARGGSTAIGVDAAWNQVSLAHGRGGGPAYARADAPSLPFASHSFDAAVSCLVLEHLDALETVATEVARALRPGGRLCCVLNHPLTQTPGSGLIDDHTVDPPERYWRVGPYLVEQAGGRAGGGRRRPPVRAPAAVALRQRVRGCGTARRADDRARTDRRRRRRRAGCDRGAAALVPAVR